MSLASANWFQFSVGFPRVSGDEPAPERPDTPTAEFSPRERG